MVGARAFNGLSSPDLEKRRAQLRRQRRQRLMREWLSMGATGLVGLWLAVVAVTLVAR